MIVEVRGLPPSDNNIYANAKGGGRYKSDAAKKWRQQVHMMFLVETTPEERAALRGQTYSLAIQYVMAVRTKKGKMRRWDVSSHQKLTVDAIAESIDSDDANCLMLEVSKAERIPGEHDHTIITLKRLGSQVD